MSAILTVGMHLALINYMLKKAARKQEKLGKCKIKVTLVNMAHRKREQQVLASPYFLLLVEEGDYCGLGASGSYRKLAAGRPGAGAVAESAHLEPQAC